MNTNYLENRSFDYVLARAKAIVTGDEMVGYIHIAGDDGRHSFTYITLPHTNEVVYVDPVSVEIYTGMRCAVTGERIFEGDIIRLYTMNGVTLNYYAWADYEDYLCEICMPLSFTKWGAQKRLYLNRVEGVKGSVTPDPFYYLAGQWDALEWEIVGRADDIRFGSAADNGMGGEKPSAIQFFDDREQTQAFNIFNKGCNIWMVNYGIDWKERETFGTFNRRKHIIRRLEENCIGIFKDYKPRYEGVRAAEFKRIVSKWERDCRKYLGLEAGESWGTN